jgi:hypothetical protein
MARRGHRQCDRLLRFIPFWLVAVNLTMRAGHLAAQVRRHSGPGSIPCCRSSTMSPSRVHRPGIGGDRHSNQDRHTAVAPQSILVLGPRVGRHLLNP